MTEQDRGAFAELMLGVGETYGEAVSEARMEIYFRALSDMALDEIALAATVHVRANKFFPRPSELREAWLGPIEDEADLAWTALLREIRRVGYLGTPSFQDEAIRRAALELFGGWERLCRMLPGEGPELLGWAKQFKAIYCGYARRDERESLPAPHTTRELDRERLCEVLARIKKES